MYDDKLKEECGVFGVFGHPSEEAFTPAEREQMNRLNNIETIETNENN